MSSEYHNMAVQTSIHINKHEGWVGEGMTFSE